MNQGKAGAVLVPAFRGRPHGSLAARSFDRCGNEQARYKRPAQFVFVGSQSEIQEFRNGMHAGIRCVVAEGRSTSACFDAIRAADALRKPHWLTWLTWLTFATPAKKPRLPRG
ncbi:hypothetical protein [Cupriavidus sp. UME77]|uniref:hypothetical protein n=1 Tax=Cupriavidus sp. UME77 TaxID=1862321 RepID=UPI0016035D62|nr:hypothetical protein [Cupriavidus sp. UME77]